MQCQVQGCPKTIPEKRVHTIGVGRVKTCSTECSRQYQKQTNAERTRNYWLRQEEAYRKERRHEK